jgi:hypothetical protein
MKKQFADLVKTLPYQGRNGILKFSAVLEKEFFGWESISIRYGLVDGCGVIPEETDKQHTHEYDQILWFVSAEPTDMLHLGAEVEVDLGPDGVRHLLAIPHTVIIPKGLPHFSPVVRRLDRPFYFLSVNCTGRLAAEIANAEAVAGTGPWNRFFGEYSKNIKQLNFAANDPYHYGSERVQASGGVSTMVMGESCGVGLTTSWSTVQLPHDLGPWRDDGKHHPHVHETFDEVFIFLGQDQGNPNALNAKLECSIGPDGDEQERYVVTKPTAITMKQGTWHLPLTFKKVDRPIVFLNISNH